MHRAFHFSTKNIALNYGLLMKNRSNIVFGLCLRMHNFLSHMYKYQLTYGVLWFFKSKACKQKNNFIFLWYKSSTTSWQLNYKDKMHVCLIWQNVTMNSLQIKCLAFFSGTARKDCLFIFSNCIDSFGEC